MPEARIPLSQAVIELSLSPKSNSAIKAIDSALSDIRKGKVGQIPNHLRDGHYQGAKDLGRSSVINILMIMRMVILNSNIYLTL